MVDTNVCDRIKVGDEVTFEVTLEGKLISFYMETFFFNSATHCVNQRDFQLFIGPSGLDEVLKLDVHVICDCDCEKEVKIIFFKGLKFIYKFFCLHLKFFETNRSKN